MSGLRWRVAVPREMRFGRCGVMVSRLWLAGRRAGRLSRAAVAEREALGVAG